MHAVVDGIKTTPDTFGVKLTAVKLALNEGRVLMFGTILAARNSCSLS